MMAAGRCSGTSLQRTGARLTVISQLLTLTEEMMSSDSPVVPGFRWSAPDEERKMLPASWCQLSRLCNQQHICSLAGRIDCHVKASCCLAWLQRSNVELCVYGVLLLQNAFGLSGSNPVHAADAW